MDGKRQEKEETWGEEEREEVNWGLQLGRVSGCKREVGSPLVGGEKGGPLPRGFCSVVSKGISDSKVNCGV